MLNHHKLILLFTSFLSPWIRIPNSDPDPEDPSIRIRFRIRKTADQCEIVIQFIVDSTQLKKKLQLGPVLKG